MRSLVYRYVKLMKLMVLFAFVWFFVVGGVAAVMGPLNFCMRTYGLMSPTICTALELQ